MYYKLGERVFEILEICPSAEVSEVSKSRVYSEIARGLARNGLRARRVRVRVIFSITRTIHLHQKSTYTTRLNKLNKQTFKIKLFNLL